VATFRYSRAQRSGKGKVAARTFGEYVAMDSNDRHTSYSKAGFGSVLRALIRRSLSPTFQRSFALILVAEAVTICTAWLLLSSNASSWVHSKAAQLVQISRVAADSRDWSLIGTVPKQKGSRLIASYRQTLKKLSNHYFPNKDGALFITVIDRGEEYIITQGDDPMDPLYDNGKADPWELRAYSSGAPTHTDAPYTDEAGTSLLAYTPIFHTGKVVGLVGVEIDSATLADLFGIVQKTFLLSVGPAVLISLAIAYILASMFGQPTDVLRVIENAAQNQMALSKADEENDPWRRLTQKEKEIAELLRRGEEHTKDLAQALSVSSETIKQHLKNIKDKTGWSKQNLAVEAAARRSAAVLRTA
jgi:DNA-binding CsgD family transcriptional regulator